MGITKLALRIAAPFPKVNSFERYLFVGPHPDDIEIGAGATVAALAAQGKNICFLICTDGRYGTVNLKEPVSEEELAAIRTEVDKYSTEGDLRREVGQNIKVKMEINSYQGTRHKKGLPVHGQSTRRNARTRKGKAVTIANKKK